MAEALLNNVSIYYEVHGQGKPLMLLAGLASDSQSWQPVIEPLSRDFIVITPDNRGAGRTRPQNAAVSIGLMARDCMALAAQLGLDRVDLLGHSMGGMIALECAIRYPRLVGKLILAGTSAHSGARNAMLLRDMAAGLDGGDKARWFRNLFYWIYSARFFADMQAVDGAVRFALRYPYGQSNQAFRRQVAAITAFDCRNELGEIRAETLVMCGKEDLLFPPETAIAGLDGIRGMQSVVIENAAHAMFLEQPQAFCSCIGDFLTQDAL